MTEFKISHDDDIIKSEDGLIFNPYNPLNVKITLSEVQSILAKYNIPTTVNNVALYERAFVHRSYTKRPNFENIQQKITIVGKPSDCMPLSSKSNERLEFLGDGVLECITKYYLYRRFPKENEGFMTEKKIAIVKNEAIGKIALEMGLHKWLILFIGALFLDFNKVSVKDDANWFQSMFVTGPGFQMAQKFIENVFEKHIDWIALLQNDDNYKNILQVKIQKEFKVTPHYLEIAHDQETGYRMGVYLCLGQPIHTVSHRDAVDISFFKTFKVIQDYVLENGKIFIFMGEGQHKIKRKAEQIACNEALTFISSNNEDINLDE